MITESVMDPGNWMVRTNSGVLRDLADRLALFGHIVILNQWLDPSDFTDAQMLAMSAYTGILTRRSHDGDKFVLSGTGLAGWLGTSGTGYVYRKQREYDEDTLTNALTRSTGGLTGLGLLYDRKRNPSYNGSNAKWTMYPISLTPGTITDPSAEASTYSGVHIYQTPIEAIEECLAWWGETYSYTMEWKVNHSGTIDIGQRSDLYVTTPTCLLTRNPGSDPEVKTVWASSVTSEVSTRGYANRVILMGSGGGFTVEVASSSTTHPAGVATLNLIGQRNQQSIMVSQPFATEAKTRELATRIRKDRARLYRNFTMDLLDYETIGTWEVGDIVGVYDPGNGIVNLSNETHYQGGLIYPYHLRITSNSWPVVPGMGVYYRDENGVYLDLTSWVEWEDRGSAEGTLPSLGR